MEELVIALLVAIYELGAWVVKRVRSWWRRVSERRRTEPDAAPTPARPAPAAARSAELEAEAERQQVATRVRDLTAAAAAAATALARDAATEPLARLVRDGLLRPAEGLGRTASASTADARTRARALAEVDGLRAGLDRVLAWGAARTGPPQGETLAAADRVAQDLVAPLRRALPDLAAVATVAVPGPLTAAERDLGRRAGVLLIPVAAGADAAPGAWLPLALTVSQELLAARPGLPEELARHLDLPRGPQRIPAVLDPSEEELLIALPVAVGLGVLLGDLIATVLLGPAYAATLATALARPDLPRAVSRLGVEPDTLNLSTLPPPVLRVGVVAAALGHLGFGVERDAVLAAWKQAHRRLRSMSYPSELQGRVEVPLTAWDGLVDRLALAALTTPLAALDGRALAQLPDLAWSSERQAAATEASALLLHQRPASAEPRVVLAAALLAQGAEPDRAVAILRPFLASLAAPVEPVPVRAWAGGEADAPLLDPAGLDPVLVREALILSAILERRGRAFGRRRAR